MPSRLLRTPSQCCNLPSRIGSSAAVGRADTRSELFGQDGAAARPFVGGGLEAGCLASFDV
jgi:hypothetical protein